jgi:hypothetical protein
MLAGLLAAAAALSFYMLFHALASNDSKGVWLFAGFGLLFGILPAFELIKFLAYRSAFFSSIHKAISPQPKKTESVRFAPHWMLMLGAIVIMLTLILIFVKVIRSLF